MKKTLAAMADEVYEVNVANGWFEDDRTFDDDIALLHTEISEAFEAYRSWGFKDATAASIKTHIPGECAFNHWLAAQGADPDGSGPPCDCGGPWTTPKPEGVGSELADILIRLLDTARRQGWDLGLIAERHIPLDTERATFSQLINALHAAVVRTDSLADDARVTWATILYGRLLGTAEFVGADLDAEYERKLVFNRTRGHRHGGKLL